MTTLQKLEQLLAMIDRIAQYELGNPDVTRSSYESCLEMVVQLAEGFDMNFYAAQCREKLGDMLGDHEPGQRLPGDAAELAVSGSDWQGEADDEPELTFYNIRSQGFPKG